MVNVINAFVWGNVIACNWPIVPNAYFCTFFFVVSYMQIVHPITLTSSVNVYPFLSGTKAKDLGITWVVDVLVGFYGSKTHVISLSLFAFLLLFKKIIFSFFLLFFMTISTYHCFIYVYLPRPTYLNLPIYVYLHQNTYLPTYINIPTFNNLPTYTNLSQPTYPYLLISTQLPTYVFLPTHKQLMSTYHHLPTYLYQSLNINL